MPFLPPSRHPLTATNWRDSMPGQANDNSTLRLPMPHGINTTISQQPPMPHSINSIAHSGTSSLNSGNGNYMIGQEGDSSIRLNAAIKNDQLFPVMSTNILPQSDSRSLPQGNLAQFAKQNYPGLEHFKVPSAVAETALKVQQSQQRLGRDANCIPETVAIYALNLSGTNIPGTNKPKRVVINDNELRTSIERGELYTKHESVVIGILTNQVHVPGFNIADYLAREKFVPHEMENIENIHSKIDPYQLICLMEFIRYRNPPESRYRVQTSEQSKTHLSHQLIDSSDFRSNLNQRESIVNTQHTNAPRNCSTTFTPLTTRPDAGLSPYEKSQSPSDTTRSQINAPRPQFGAHLSGGPNYPGSSHPLTSLANNPRMNSLFFTPMTRDQKPAQATTQTLPLLKVSSPFQPPMSIGAQPLARPPRSHSTIGGLGLGPLDGPSPMSAPSQIRHPPAAHQSSSRPNIPCGLDMSAPAHSFNPPVAAHLSSKTPQTPRLQDTIGKLNIKSPAYANNTYLNKSSINAQLTTLGQIDQLGSPTKQTDIDSANGLPMQNVLRQQEIANRELVLRRSITPHFHTQNIGGNTTHPSLLGSRGGELSRLDLGPGSPSQMHLSHLSNQDFYRLPGATQSVSMPPPHSRPYDVNRLSSMSISHPTTTTNGDAQLKQYSTMMTAYQQPNLSPNKISDMNSGAPLITTQQHSPVSNYYPSHSGATSSTDHPHLDVQHPQPPPISPKQQNQRSIITGSASASAKRGKKPKSSPPINAQLMSELKGTNVGGTSATDVLQKELQENKVALLSNSVVSNNPVEVQNPPANNPPANNDAEERVCKSISATAPTASVQASNDPLAPAVSDSQSNRSTPSQTCNNSTSARCIDDNLLGANCPSQFSSNTENLAGGDSDCLSDSLDINRNKNDSNSISINSSSSTVSTCDNQNSERISEPSKYQKLFTKKAWLKIYDQEDQAKSSESTNEDNISIKASVKIEAEAVDASKDENIKENPKASQVTSKTNGNSKSNKSSNIDSKKKAKVGRGKSSSLSSLKNNRNTTDSKGVENDSEETTSDLDDTTDEADSMKSTDDKKLRRMPIRKVKINPDRESNQSNSALKPRSLKDASRKRIKREKATVNTSDNDSNPSSVTKRKYNSDDEGIKQKTKKIKNNNGKLRDHNDQNPKNKKRPSEKFLQTCPCYDIVPKNIRCMECRRVRQSSLKNDKVVPSKQTSRTNWDDFCRFYEFRKLRYNKSDQIIVAGFSEMMDAKDSDKRIWLPNTTEIPKNFNYNVAKFIISNVGVEFCNLVLQERAIQQEYESRKGDKKITWKRAVNELRELCDVCSTTLFNCHFVCERCGFVVCIDCHRHRASQQDNLENLDENMDMKKENSPSVVNENGDEQATVPSKKSKKDSSGWMYCAKNEEHSADKMILARIVAGDCLEEVWTLLHETRIKLGLGDCPCMKQTNRNNVLDSCETTDRVDCDSYTKDAHSTLKGLLLAPNSPTDCSVENETAKVESVADAENSEGKSDLHMATPKDNKVFEFTNEDDSQDDSRQVSAAIEECIAALSAKGSEDDPSSDMKPTHSISSTKSNEIWTTLCGGDLLVLNQPKHKENLQLFRNHWRLGKPVLVRGVHKSMNINLWLPQFFAVQFGDYRSDLVDCRNGDIHRQSMKKYWDGFEPSVNAKKKSRDDAPPSHIPPAPNEEPSAITTTYYSGSALWRLKDWPPGQDFNEILPEHYNDFMNNLPLRSYTTRTGKLNLACRLPKEMLKPDLGPKMYSAYGTTKFPERGTTNLHLDISDAINVMVYVGGASSLSNGSELREMFDRTVSESQVEPDMKTQIRKNGLIPGALWHIFKPSDAPKMREFLNKVADERKISPEKRTDPIHDQIWYLDQNLLDRLYNEYGVKSYSILQCMGDAILIPAGAPHQVKNFQNCIKVANDFVSPENVRWCLKLTDEFRKLPETHINQEDKLQIKNILYHSVKESLQFIKMSRNEEVNNPSRRVSSDDTDADKTESDSESNDDCDEVLSKENT